MQGYIERQPIWQQLRPPAKSARGALRSIVVSNPHEHLMFDLGHMQQYKAANGGYEYLFVGVDLMSRRLWVVPLKDATQKSTTKALRDVLATLPDDGATVRVVSTDNGVEFAGAFDNLLKERHIRHKYSKPGVPQSQGAVEKAVQTVKRAVVMWTRVNRSDRYVPALEGIVDGINRRASEATGVPPLTLDRGLKNVPKEELDYARERVGVQVKKVEKRREQGEKPLKVGDLVRLQIASKNPLRKSWEFNWSGEVYHVKAVQQVGELTMYRVADAAGKVRTRLEPRRALLLIAAPDASALDARTEEPRRAPVREQREAAALAAETEELERRNPRRRSEEEESASKRVRKSTRRGDYVY